MIGSRAVVDTDVKMVTLLKRGPLGHGDRRSCEHEGRYWGDASANQGTPKRASKPSKLGEKNGDDSPLGLPEGPASANALMSDFRPP